MGRHKNIPHEKRGIERGRASDKKASAAVLKRLGFGKQICQRCNAKSPTDADKCRKCGYGDLRKKKHDYRAEYTSNNSGR